MPGRPDRRVSLGKDAPLEWPIVGGAVLEQVQGRAGGRRAGQGKGPPSCQDRYQLRMSPGAAHLGFAADTHAVPMVKCVVDIGFHQRPKALASRGVTPKL